MANTLKPVIERGLGRMVARLDSPQFIWNGTSYPCVPSTLRRGNEVEVGGHVWEIELTLYVRKVDLPLGVTVDSTIDFADSTLLTADNVGAYRPASGKKLTRGPWTYRIIRVSDPSPDAHWELDLASPHK